MNKNSALTGSYAENPFCYHQFDLRQSTILEEVSQFRLDAADNWRLYVTTMKARSFQDVSSVPSDNFKDHNVLVFDLI